MKAISTILFMFFAPSQIAFAQPSLGKLSKLQQELRIEHSKELLGGSYGKSVVQFGESITKINLDIYKITKDRLPKAHKKDHQRVAQAIIDHALQHGFDPVFLVAVISGESSFHPRAVGGVGEIGLMQIRESTARWISELKGISYQSEKDLYDPVKNIEIGSAYLAYLRDLFDNHAQLYLAAYNMGQGRTAKLVEKKVYPKDYPLHVMSRYIEIYEDLKSKADKRSIAEFSVGSES